MISETGAFAFICRLGLPVDDPDHFTDARKECLIGAAVAGESDLPTCSMCLQTVHRLFQAEKQ